MNDKNQYYIGQGRVYAGVRSCAGVVTNGLRYLGNCPELRIMHNVDYITHNESTTGQRNKDLELPQTKEVMAQITMESWDLDNLALLTTGIASEIVGTTVTNETVRCPSVKGSWVPLANINLISFTSLGSLVRDTDYSVDLKSGMIYFTPTGGATINTDYAASYTFDDTEKIIPFNQLLQNEYFLRFAGLNTVENNTPVVIDAFRVKFRATEELQLITQEIAPIQVQAAILFNSKQIDSNFYQIKTLLNYCENSEPEPEPEPDPFIPDGELIYCQFNVSGFRPVGTVNGNFTYCLFDLANSGFDRSP
ncbi:phage tail tube protein [Microcystis aeruginosa]|uniref:phage tail tube protein n=1 Tax=Microcystis aeruginosa TaxID=1126 RepID=UPI00077666F8|nr:hypothetical protein [Microcystis aeruginosa]KXS91914.1 hypothetical protein OA58_08870 [Microcystis aeruginosa NIES-88]BCU10908.1 hypothetical protein MAN88_14720 [Microcystis aeruginosa]